MPFLCKLAKRVARLRSRPFLVAVAVVAGACAKEVASLGAPADGTPPVTIQLPSADAAPGASIAVVFRATEPLAAIQETVAFDPQRLRYERPGNGPDLVVVNDEAAAQGSLRVLATNPQGLAPTGVTLVFTVTASGYTEGVRGTVEVAVAPDDRLVWGAAPSAPARVAGTSVAGSYRFGDANLDGLINVFDVLLLNKASTGAATLLPQPFLLANVRPVNGGAAATGVPPCDPTTTCRPGVTPADAQSPNGLIDNADAAALASFVVGVSVPVVGELAPTGPSTPTAVASVTVSPATASISVGQLLQLTATPKDSAGGALTGRTVTWTSSNTSVATVSSSGLVTGSVAGTATITATSEGKTGSAAVTVAPVPVASVVISPPPSIRVGQTVQLTATLKDSTGNTLTGRTVMWGSGDTTVARVSLSGLMTGVAEGSATITATSEGKSSTATITVALVPVASVAVSPATASVAVGQTLQLAAMPKDSAGAVLNGRTVTWMSDNTSVATVSSSGQVSGVAQGSATITATSEGKSSTAAITVASGPVASVLVSPATANIRVGQTWQLTATLKDSTGNTLAGRAVTWTSSNAVVATVSSSGLVNGVLAGTATITATSEGKTGTAAATVTLIPVASVVVSPATAMLPAKGTMQLAVTLKDASGNTLTLSGRTVAWTSSAPTIATVSPSGLVTDVADGGATTITATSEGRSGTSVITVQAALPAGSVADPTLLAVASGQAPNVAAYTALNVPNQPAGFSYRDPVTGVRVWKVTSSSVPTGNSGAGHDYSDGPNEVSLGWGANNDTHTILVGAPQGSGLYYLVDFTRGVGLTNYRRLSVQPAHDLGVTFSNLAEQPRIAYIMTSTQIVRYNTATMQVENTGNFPLDLNQIGGGFGWIQHDKNDVWFAGLPNDQRVAFAWNSRTNHLLTHRESWLNEPRLERDGRYIALTNGNSTFRLWDLDTNTFGPTQSSNLYWLGHNADLRSLWVTTDVNASAPFDLDRYAPAGGQIVRTRIFNNSAGPAVHHSGNWVQSDAELGGDLNRQWSVFSGVYNDWVYNANATWKEAIGLVRSDGSDARLLVHHYSAHPGYWDDPFAQSSPDGKVVIFNSTINGSGRYDLFVAEMPLR